MLIHAHKASRRSNSFVWRVALKTSGNEIKKTVKASHTRYRALGPEQIPVYKQSARRWP